MRFALALVLGIAVVTLAGSTYTAVVKGGPAGVADVAGNRLSNDVSWAFTTLAAPPPAPPGLVAAYGFNEGAGTVLNDVSGRSNHGTITGATWTTNSLVGFQLAWPS